MNFDKLTDFAITMVLAAALAGNLDSFTKWVYVARAKLLHESRTETWGSPDFFKNHAIKYQRRARAKNCRDSIRQNKTINHIKEYLLLL